MAKHVLGQFADARLSLVDDILMTAGWKQSGAGWTPPGRWRMAIEIGHGRGHFSRALAIAFTVLGDEVMAATQK